MKRFDITSFEARPTVRPDIPSTDIRGFVSSPSVPKVERNAESQKIEDDAFEATRMMSASSVKSLTRDRKYFSVNVPGRWIRSRTNDDLVAAASG